MTALLVFAALCVGTVMWFSFGRRRPARFDESGWDDVAVSLDELQAPLLLARERAAAYAAASTAVAPDPVAFEPEPVVFESVDPAPEPSESEPSEAAPEPVVEPLPIVVRTSALCVPTPFDNAYWQLQAERERTWLVDLASDEVLRTRVMADQR